MLKGGQVLLEVRGEVASEPQFEPPQFRLLSVQLRRACWIVSWLRSQTGRVMETWAFTTVRFSV